MTERISVQDILEAGIHTRSNTELWVEIEDAMTPRCEHSQHDTCPEQHGGGVHRLVKWAITCGHPTKELYICDGLYETYLAIGSRCRVCTNLSGPENLIVLAEF